MRCPHRIDSGRLCGDPVNISRCWSAQLLGVSTSTFTFSALLQLTNKRCTGACSRTWTHTEAWPSIERESSGRLGSHLQGHLKNTRKAWSEPNPSLRLCYIRVCLQIQHIGLCCLQQIKKKPSHVPIGLHRWWKSCSHTGVLKMLMTH